MTQPKDTLMKQRLQIVQQAGPESLRALLQTVCQAVLEAQMTQFLQAERYERTEQRRGYRNGYKPCTLTTRLGTLELRVSQDRGGRFSTSLFARYQRSEQVLCLQEMYLQGVSTRKVRFVTEALCEAGFSAALVSELSGTPTWQAPAQDAILPSTEYFYRAVCCCDFIIGWLPVGARR